MSDGRPPPPPGPYLVAGLARAGRAAVDALQRGTRDPVLAWDCATDREHRRAAAALRKRGVEVWLGGDGVDVLEHGAPVAALVKSPGVGFDSPLIERAQERGLCVLDELELGWRLSRAPIVAVTGTNGKSTTCALAVAVLEAGGHRVQLAGNTDFGPPLSAVPPGGWVVCEVSSFQLEGSSSFLPDVAVFTNLTTEHLDRHGTMERYGELKRRMFVRGKRTALMCVVNLDDPFGRALVADIRAAGGRVLSYGRASEADFRIVEA
ncbi:MAG TPA: Mur ligase family protein, partial [Solirubrobacteraceae bacterium]|nr:Mur ligase family protein [Solirubrobacteraceae bacterium]